MPTFWGTVRTRYSSYLLVAAELATIPVAILVIKQNAPLQQQLNDAAYFMVAFTLAVVATLPANYVRGMTKRFMQLRDGPWSIDVPMPPGFMPYTRDATPLEVDGVLIPRTELVIPVDKEIDVSGPLPSLRKAKAFRLTFHGLKDRIDYRDGIVYYGGTPINSANAEIANGYFVDPDVALGDSEFGPTAQFEVFMFTHGDRQLYTNPMVMDLFWASVYRERPDLEAQAMEAVSRTR